MRSSKPAAIDNYCDNSPNKKFYLKSGSLLMSNLGQLFCTASWNGVSYLEPHFAKIQRGYPLLLCLQGLASATVMLPFYYVSYRLDGYSNTETFNAFKMDFPLSWLFDGSWQFFSDVTVAFYRGGPIEWWADPSYEGGELVVGIGVFQFSALLNFIITESKARYEGTTWDKTVERIGQSILMGLVSSWFFDSDKWFGNFYSERGETASEKAGDSLKSGLIVAVGSLSLDLALIFAKSVVGWLKEYCRSHRGEVKYEPMQIEMGKKPKYQSVSNALSDVEAKVEEKFNAQPQSESYFTKAKSCFSICYNNLPNPSGLFGRSKPKSVVLPPLVSIEVKSLGMEH